MNQENNDSANLVALYKKIHKVKSELDAVTKGTVNGFFKSKYADLNAHLEVVEPLLQKNGLVLTQSTVAAGQVGNVAKSDITDIESGAQISSSLILPKLEDMQKLGGAITYARRYTLSALLGMVAEDDDGNTATGKKAAPAQTKPSKRDF